MFYQSKPGIYVYHIDRSVLANAELVTNYYGTLHDLFLSFSEWQLAMLFGDMERIYVSTHQQNDLGYARRAYYRNDHPFCFYAAYDERGMFYAPDHLVGLYRKWRKERDTGLIWWRGGSYKASGYRRYRRPKTKHSRTEISFSNPDLADLPIYVKVDTRCDRDALPNSWDDIRRFNDRSWKTQSRRKHQWK